MVDILTNLVSRIVSQMYICVKVYQNLFFTYVQFICVSFTSIGLELEINEEEQEEEKKRGGKEEGEECKRKKRSGRRRKGDKEKENGEKEMSVRTHFFHISLQLAPVAKRGQGHRLPRNTDQTGTTATLDWTSSKALYPSS